MDTTNLQTGTSGKTMLLDFVQEVQVKSSGYNAEFGGATGGVINVLTKSGSNSFHGQGGTYFTNDGLQGAIRPTNRFNPQHTNIPESGLNTRDDEWRYYQPAGRCRRPDMQGQAVVLRRRRLHQEQLRARRDVLQRSVEDDAAFHVVGRREVLQLQRQHAAVEQPPR